MWIKNRDLFPEFLKLQKLVFCALRRTGIGYCIDFSNS